MCYSAEAWTLYDGYVKEFGADIDIEEFWKLYLGREERYRIRKKASDGTKIPKGMDLNFLRPRTDLERKVQDLLIVDRSINARPGHTIVVLWEGGFTVKKLYVRGNRIVLASSAGYPPIIVPEDIELDVWGVVRSNIHFHV